MKSWDKYGIMVNDWDSLLQIKFRENCLQDKVFCDVGACNGVFTSLFKELAGKNGKVIAFEMNPFNYSAIKYLESENCKLENLAVTNKIGTVNFYADNLGSGNHTSNIVGHDSSGRMMDFIKEVKSTSLDEYFNGQKIDYIKIDVEGAEIGVISGAINTIKNCNYIIIECHFDEDWVELFNLLKSTGLDFRNIVDDEPIKLEETKQEPGISSNGKPYQIYAKN